MTRTFSVASSIGAFVLLASSASVGGSTPSGSTEFLRSNVISDVAVQGDGRVVAAGTTGTGENPFVSVLTVMRFMADGRADPTFGDGDGVVIHYLPENDLGFIVENLAIDPSGRPVIAGRSNAVGGRALVRLRQDGSLDPSFDQDGVLRLSGYSYTAARLAIQPDGKILLAGWYGERRGITRYNADGTIDTSFGQHGFVPEELLAAIAVQPDGKILTGGSSGLHCDTSGATCRVEQFVARHNAGGSLDTTFGGNGISEPSFAVVSDFYCNPPFSRPNDLIVGPQGEITTAGGAGRSGGSVRGCGGSPTAATFARYSANGSLSQSFGDGGKVLVPACGPAVEPALASDGSLLAVSGSYLTANPALVRENCALHLSASGDVLQAVPLSYPRALSWPGADGGGATPAFVGPDGRVLAAGVSPSYRRPTASMTSFAVAAFNPLGEPDANWGGDGVALMPEVPTCEGWLATAVGTPGPDPRVAGGGVGSLDVLVGLGGDDRLVAGDGQDVACGGGGDDKILGYLDREDDRFYGGPGADSIWGAGGADILLGEAGPDRLFGGPGRDRLFGGAGKDLLSGGGGKDHLGGGPGEDVVRP